MGGAVFERVRTSYPYPLARYARAYLTADSQRERYDAALDLAERLTILLGAAGLTWARALGIGDKALRDWRGGLRFGITLGRWLTAARTLAAEASRTGHELGGLAPALATPEAGLNVPLDRLMRFRNDDAHGGPPRGDVDLAETLSELTPCLEQALAGAEFLATTDLLLIQGCHAQRYERAFAVSALLMAGDHPDFLPIQLTSSDVFLERTVVLRHGSDAFDMMPFALVEYCQTCRGREVFYPSRLDGPEAVFVSFESNHQLRTDKWVGELRGETSPTFLSHRVGQSTHATVTAFTAVTAPPKPADRPAPAPSSPAAPATPAKPADRPAPAPPPPAAPATPAAPARPAAPAAPPTAPRSAPMAPAAAPSGPAVRYPPPPPPPAERRGPAAQPAPAAPTRGARREPSPTGRSARLLGRRGLARVIDLVVSFALLVLASIVVAIPDALVSAEATESGEATTSGPATATALVLWIGGSLAYEIVGTARFGGTLGKKAAKLRVTDREGDLLGPGRAAGRALAAVVLLVLFPMTVLDILWPLWDPHGDMLHDKVAGTRVVRSG